MNYASEAADFYREEAQSQRSREISAGSDIRDFVVKDSGKRQDYESGMRRDVEDGKIDFTLALDGPMFKRYAEHLTKGAAKYGRRNWQLANSAEEMERFKRSAIRHLIQWLDGDRDEDHAAAVIFNVNAAEYVRERIDKTEWDLGPGDTITRGGRPPSDFIHAK